MAITINQQPPTFSPAYNPLIFVVTSNHTAEDNFQYVFDVYWDSVFQTRHRLPARPADGKAIFDAMRMIEDQISHDIDSDISSQFGKNINSYVKFQIKFGEEYDVAGVKTLFTDLATSNNIYAFNSVFDYFDFVDYDSADYLLGASSSKFLTNAPLTQKVATGDLLWLYTINDTPSQYINLRIDIFDTSGTLVSVTSISNPYTSATDDNKFLRVGVGPANLLEAFGSTFLDGISYYTVKVINISNFNMSETRRFNLDSECSKYTPIRLHWLNKLGGFDAKSFIQASFEESTIERKNYKRSTGTLSGSTFSFSKSDRSEHALTIGVNDGITINSNWLSDAESTWLKELVTSPVVFQELNGELIPVTIRETRYTPQKKDNNKVFNLSIKFDYSITNYRQRY